MQFENLLERYYFDRYVLDICITTLERGGVTTKPDTHEFLSSIEAWGLPKYPDKTMIFPVGEYMAQEIKKFIAINKTCLQEPDCWLGTWINPQTYKCYLDITRIYFCLDEARKEAIAQSHKARRKVVALYDFKQGQPVYL